MTKAASPSSTFCDDLTITAVCSAAYDAPCAVLDGNVFRVLARLFDIDLPIDSTAGKRTFAELAQTQLDMRCPGRYNQAVMDFGALQCTPAQPGCADCPLAARCLALAAGTVAERPVKQAKTKVRDRWFNYLHVTCGDRTLLRRRGEGDIWQGLYEFPMIETDRAADFSELTDSEEFRTVLGGVEWRLLRSVAMPKFKLMQKLVDRMNLVSREILTGLSVIRAFSREKFEEKRFDEANQNLMKTQLFTNRVMTFMMPAMMLIMNCVTVMIVWFGAKGIDAGNLQVGDMMAFMTYTMQIVMSFLMITMVSVMLPRAGVAADRIEEILRTDSSIVDAKKTEDEKLTQCRGELRFEDVSFKYPGAEGDVLEHISFTAKPGQTTAVIGSTGCGKSTLIQLIPRFYDVTEGKITLDGVDIRNLSQHKLREVMGLVPQKGVLFSGTIASNIKLAGEDEISDETMKEAAQTAQATEFIDAKPEGYDSPVAQGGSNVSGGQKQRLAIARVIAKHPKVYLFDDSFSALDYKTDAALRKALHEQAADATVLIVAQRISTIMNAEQILVLEDGKIVGKGTHEELMKNCSAYQEIARSQLSESELKGGMAE